MIRKETKSYPIPNVIKKFVLEPYKPGCEWHRIILWRDVKRPDKIQWTLQGKKRYEDLWTNQAHYEYANLKEVGDNLTLILRRRQRLRPGEVNDMGIHHEDENVMEDGYELIRWCSFFGEGISSMDTQEMDCPVWIWQEAREDKAREEFPEDFPDDPNYFLGRRDEWCDQCPYIKEKMAKVRHNPPQPTSG